jgi:predicted AlkP superfamily pyrophosphatase or phosphodiesterase
MTLRTWAIGLVFLGAASGSPAAAAQAPAPKLIVAVAVDQFSADLFAEYRARFTGGFARLLGGAVFPSGYQSHANTETCPGHSTILTGARPSRTGIISNSWENPRIKRAQKTIYCVEDENAPGPSQVISPVHLRVPTLGDRLKAATPASRVVSVAGKDRSAVLLGGHKADEAWWWRGTRFESYAGRKMPAAVAAANTAATGRLEAGGKPYDLPDVCKPYERDVVISPSLTVGSGRLAYGPKDATYYQGTPAADTALMDMAVQLAKDMKLGQGAATDVLAVGLSATDYVGHYFGTAGTEMCIHLMNLDQALSRFFTALDATGVDYAVALTGDHGGHDIPERARGHGIAEGDRIDGSLAASNVGKQLADSLKLPGKVLFGDQFGLNDFWLDPVLTPEQREIALKGAVAFYKGYRQVAEVFTAEQLRAAAAPLTPPDEWTPLERARASYDAERSGDFVILLKSRVMPSTQASKPYTTMHGSAWDYDRRVPIVFWRKGMARFEQPLAVETADIMPTLAAMIGLKVPANEIDGRCLFGCQ